MNKEYLIKTARELKSVSSQASEEYNMKSYELTQRIDDIMLNRDDINKLVGPENIEMMKNNHSNHVRFMASIMKEYHAEVMSDTVLWVFNAYQNHGFTTNYWAAQLDSWIGIIKEVLTPESFAEILPFYEWMQINIPIFVKVSNEAPQAHDKPHH